MKDVEAQNDEDEPVEDVDAKAVTDAFMKSFFNKPKKAEGLDVRPVTSRLCKTYFPKSCCCPGRGGNDSPSS